MTEDLPDPPTLVTELLAAPVTAGNIARLRAVLSPRLWKQQPGPLVTLCNRILRSGYARDVLDLLPPAAEDDSRSLVHLRAYALVNTGAPWASAEILRNLIQAGQAESEDFGLLGRTEKDLARRATTPAAANEHWRRAFSSYRSAYEVTSESYPGINAATLAFRLGDRSTARQLAAAVCATLLERAATDYWALATIGEAQLLLGDLEQAAGAYKRAVQAAGEEVAAVGSMIRQARELLRLHGLPEQSLDAVFSMVAVAVFAGHRVDAADSAQQRLGVGQLSAVRARLRECLRAQRIGIVFSAAADGADLLLLEALTQAGGQSHLVLPTDVDTFRRLSVANDPYWQALFDRVLDAAASLTIASDGLEELDDTALNYANEVSLGLARIKAQEIGADLVGLSVWDEHPGLPGGTGSSVALWQRAGVPVTNVRPDAVSQLVPARSITVGPARSPRAVAGLLFADVVGYSRFTEAQVASYYTEVLPQVAALCRAGGRQPLVEQTFGDAFYFVCRSVVEAASIALDLQQLFQSGLTLSSGGSPLSIRISVHAGPLLPVFDPVMARENYTGRHASRAARVESLTGDNQVLATQQMAALLAVRAPQRFELVYAGERALPKNYGKERLYALSEHGVAATREPAPATD